MTDNKPMQRPKPRRRWIEGLDWLRAENVFDPDLGGSPEAYISVLAGMLNYLPDTDPDRHDALHAEILRRVKNGSMDEQQRDCVLAAMQRSAAHAKEMYDIAIKVFGLRVVKDPDGTTRVVEGLKVISGDGDSPEAP
jgi:hypothetical protein